MLPLSRTCCSSSHISIKKRISVNNISRCSEEICQFAPAAKTNTAGERNIRAALTANIASRDRSADIQKTADEWVQILKTFLVMPKAERILHKFARVFSICLSCLKVRVESSS